MNVVSRSISAPCALVSLKPMVSSTQGVSGITYFLQLATNLATPVSWETIATNVAGPNGLIQFVDPQPTNALARFYRTLTR